MVAQTAEIAGEAMTDLAARLGGDGEEALLVVNPDAARRPVRLVSDRPLPGGQPAEDGFVLASRDSVPAFSAVIARPTPMAAVTVTERSLENDFVRVELADDGTIERLYDKRARREVLDGRRQPALDLPRPAARLRRLGPRGRLPTNRRAS